jgi:hypothetical protein
MTEIAKAYGVQWVSDRLPRSDAVEDGEEEVRDASKATYAVTDIAQTQETGEEQPPPFESKEEKANSTSESQLTKLPQSPSTEEPPSKVTKAQGASHTAKGTSVLPPSSEDDFDALAKRFEALKRK